MDDMWISFVHDCGSTVVPQAQFKSASGGRSFISVMGHALRVLWHLGE